MLKGKFRAFLAWYIITLSFTFVFLITLVPAAQASKSNDTILGFLLGTGLAAVIAFYFGSNEDPNKGELFLPEKKPIYREVKKDDVDLIK